MSCAGYNVSKPFIKLQSLLICMHAAHRAEPSNVGMQITFMSCCVLLTIVALTYIFARSKPVYLIDYHCYKPPDRLKMPHQKFLELSRNCGVRLTLLS